MAVHGDLSTMALTDLLQWAAASRKSGTLRVERNQIGTCIHLNAGRVTGCSSEDPPALLGQFLLSRGRIEKEQLRRALERQEVTGESVGDILVESGALTRDELTRVVREKAEETIFGLFDGEGGFFRFEEKEEPDRYRIDVDLQVQEIVLRGLQRHDEMQQFRNVFPEEGAVLRRTEKSAPEPVMGNRMARRILESINGERTLAEVLIHAHASEYHVTKFLYQLHRLGIIEISGVRQVNRETAAQAAALEQAVEERLAVAGGAPVPVVAPHPEPATGPVAVPAAHSTGEVGGIEPGGPAGPGGPTGDGDGPSDRPGEEARDEPPPAAAASGDEPHNDLTAEIRVATELMQRGEHEVALQMLHAVSKAYPGDASLRRLIREAETGVERAHRKVLTPEQIPVLRYPMGEIPQDGLSPEAAFLPSLIDGRTDIKSILWLAPLRTVDVLRALKQMLDRNLITLRDPQAS